MPPDEGGEGHADPVSTIFEDTSVLVVTDFETIKPKLTASLPNVTTTFAATTRDAYTAFDSTTAVVCLFDNLLDEAFESFRTDVLLRYPFCQFVVIESRPLAHDCINDYDVILQGPVSARHLRTVVRKRLIYAEYSTTLQKYYQLNATAMALARLDNADRLLSDHVADRIRAVLPRLRTLKAGLSEAELREIAAAVEKHKQHVNQPTKRAEGSAQSKYHPRTCPECGVVWGDDHENELGRGFERLGADVWKCTLCEEIVHALHDSNRSTIKH